MSFTNFVAVDGNIVRDAEIKYTQSGLAVASFSLAHNRKVKDRDEVFYFDVTVMGKHAEMIIDRLRKGTMALVVGHLRQRRWEDDRGNKRSKVEILSNQVMFGKGSDSENQPHVDEDMPF